MEHTKIYQEDLHSPRQELSNGGLRFVVAFLVCLRIDLLCARTEKMIQL